MPPTFGLEDSVPISQPRQFTAAGLHRAQWWLTKNPTDIKVKLQGSACP
jgi:hypothetical protein